jgi:hypothetical protein
MLRSENHRGLATLAFADSESALRAAASRTNFAPALGHGVLLRDKKSPAQGGPARGSSAPGLGGKNERAEPHKPGGPCLVPLRPSFFFKIFGSRICSGPNHLPSARRDNIPILAGDPSACVRRRALLSRPTRTPSLRDEKKQQFTQG